VLCDVLTVMLCMSGTLMPGLPVVLCDVLTVMLWMSGTLMSG
jgi:hypothetical protein